MNRGLYGKPLARDLEYEDEFVGAVGDNSARTLTADATWETLSGTTFSWDARRVCSYRVEVYVGWRQNSAQNRLVDLRLLIDGVTDYISQASVPVATTAASYDTTSYALGVAVFDVVDLPAGGHSLEVQSRDGGSSVDREFHQTQVLVLRVA